LERRAAQVVDEEGQREVIGADELFQGLVVEAYTTLFFWKEILEDQGSYRSVST